MLEYCDTMGRGAAKWSEIYQNTLWSYCDGGCFIIINISFASPWINGTDLHYVNITRLNSCAYVLYVSAPNVQSRFPHRVIRFGPVSKIWAVYRFVQASLHSKILNTALSPSQFSDPMPVFQRSLLSRAAIVYSVYKSILSIILVSEGKYIRSFTCLFSSSLTSRAGFHTGLSASTISLQ